MAKHRCEIFCTFIKMRTTANPQFAVIYEAHVRSMTMLHPEIPQSLRTFRQVLLTFTDTPLTRTTGGTYAAMGMTPVIQHLKSLGVTAVELLPVHHHVDEQHLRDKGAHPDTTRNVIESHVRRIL